MNFNYLQLRGTIGLRHMYLPISRRLRTFLAYDGDLWFWALARWNDANKVYHSCQGYTVK